MSFLNLRRLLPPRKLWKVISNKLQIRLKKLNKSRAIKKNKIRPEKASKKHSWLKPTLSIQPKKFKHKKRSYFHSQTSLGYQYHSLCHLKQRTAPVYVDKLFIQPAVSIVKEQQVGESSENKEKSEEGKMADHDDQNMHADDMWESLVIASPQMNGINERAEEFIARFRAQMHHQENLAP
ncbi:uncharacterized protein Fot_17242 [Forsythia ovata]|uniref:Uncharacterized protein n=1 Tax=Forsythia ovata TaxID=205694 RepID=A0ABD1VF45_9LAMI